MNSILYDTLSLKTQPDLFRIRTQFLFLIFKSFYTLNHIFTSSPHLIRRKIYCSKISYGFSQHHHYLSFQNNVYGLPTGRTRESLRTGPLPRRVRQRRVGPETQPERIARSGVVPESPCQMAKTRTTPENRLHIHQFPQLHHAHQLHQQRHTLPLHPGREHSKHERARRHLELSVELRSWVAFGFAEFFHNAISDLWVASEWVFLHAEFAWQPVVWGAHEDARVSPE